jgi:hypothetical protein
MSRVSASNDGRISLVTKNTVGDYSPAFEADSVKCVSNVPLGVGVTPTEGMLEVKTTETSINNDEGNTAILLRQTPSPAHGITNYLPTDAHLKILSMTASAETPEGVGGTRIISCQAAHNSGVIGPLDVIAIGQEDDDYPFIKFTAAKGSAPGATSIAADRIALRVANYTANVFDIFGNGAFKPATFNQTAEPTTSQIPAGGCAFWTDTDDSKCYICYNHGGTIKTVELT